MWHGSLMHGPIPVAVQLITAAALVYAIGRRSWLLPLSVVAGVVTGLLTRWFYGTLGLASEPAPWQLWLWVSLAGTAIAVAAVGWPSAGGWRRNASVFAASFCLLSTGLTINGWLGYFPTVHAAWNQLADRPLPNQSDLDAVLAMRRKHVVPQQGSLVAVTTSTAGSGFAHRREWVYLPPAWFSGTPLPAIMMIGGEFNTPADWVRVGRASATLDEHAATHAGEAPVAVFVDATGGFTNDTECVNGPRGNAADHLTSEVVPEIGELFGLADETKWGVVGFSSGGTCAVDLAVMHPEIFGAFVDIGGDIGPNAGTREQTIDRLFNGDADKYWMFDPATAMTRHGRYADLAGLFAIPGTNAHRKGVGQDAADELCRVGARNGISCKVVALPGKHDWPSAADAFALTLPWLVEQLDTADLRS